MSDREQSGTKTAAVPEVPGVLRLGWMLFMQPIKLHRMFAVSGGPNLAFRSLWRKTKEGDRWARTVLKSSCLVALTWFPAIVLSCTVALTLLGGTVSWPKACAGVLLGVVGSCVASLGEVTQALRLGLALSLGFLLFGATEVRELSASGFALFAFLATTALSLLMSSAPAKPETVTTGGRVRQTITMVLTFMIAPFGRACGAGQPLKSVLREVWFFVGAGIGGLVFVQIHTYLFECLWVLSFVAMVRIRASVAPRFARALPFRYHDTIFFPLPGLRSFS